MAKKNQMVRPATARKPSRKEGGQALVEYALILALVIIAILGIIALTGPAVGNVFSNAVWNLLNQTVTPYDTLSPDELVGYLTAVASYTPPPRGQAATGTVAPTFTKTNTPVPLFTYTPTFTKTATQTATASPTGPTGTPPDVQFNTNNVYRVNNLDEWHYDTMVTGGAQEPSRARILWNVDYFNNTSFTGAVANDTLNDHLKFNWGAGAPRSGVNADNFSIRYTAKSFSDGLVTVPFTANEVWQIRVTGNQNIKVIIGGATIVNLTMADDSVGTKVAYYYSPTTTRQSVVVEASDTTGDASVEVVINRVADYGDCHWTSVSNDYRSQAVAMADSGETAGQFYRPNGSCTLRQRGWYDLTNTAAIPNPRLIFWNKWKLNTADSLQVGVRKYDDPNDRWTWTRVQKITGNNFNWNRQIVNLKSFPVSFDDAAADMPTALGSQPASEPITTKDFSGHKIEIAFRVVSDATQENDGWYVDDIGVFDWNPALQAFPYNDPIDGSTATNWVNECKWSLVADTSSGTTRSAWSTGRYTNGSDCSLTLDRQLTVPTADVDPNTPLLTFDAKTRLDSGDQVRVEYALPTDDLMSNASWHALPLVGNSTPNGCVSPVGLPPGTDYSIYCSTTNMAWETLRIDLGPLRGQTVMLRFRLYADLSGDAPIDAANPYGWSIDNVNIETNNIDEVPIPFVEPFSTTSNWTLNGWALTTGSDPYRSAPTALTDSTGGTAYTPITNITTQLNPAVRIEGSTNPIVSFYTRWQAPTANLQLDFSVNDGLAWSPIWQFNRPTMGDENRAWERFEVNLVSALAAVGRTVDNTPRVMFRFTMKATGSLTVGDGFYIDDFRVEETPGSIVTLNAGNNFTYTEQLTTAPTVSSVLSTPPQWNVGGDWAWQPTVGRNNSGGFTDSPLGSYNSPQRSNLEYGSLINTSAAQFPALAFWTKYNMASGHNFAVDFKPTGGTWTQVWSNNDPAVATPSNLGWHRVVIAIDSALAQPIRVRFRLSAMDSTTPLDGIYLDDIQFVDRAVWTDFSTTIPSFTAAIDQVKWIKEGDWKVPATTTPVNATYGVMYGKPEVKVSTLTSVTAVNTDWGGSIGSTSQWATEYWHTNAAPPWGGAGTTMNWTTLLAGSPQVTQITPDLSLDVPSDPTNLPIPPGVTAWNTGPAKNDYYAIRWRRRFTAPAGGTYLLRLQVTGGAEVWVGGSLLSPNTTLPPPYASAGSASNVAQPAARTYYYTATIGTNTLIDVRFWHSTDGTAGGAKIDFGIAEQRTIAKASEYATKYTHLTKTSLILDGYVTLPSGMTGVVSYDERWSIALADYATAYYSVDRGSTWTAVGSTQHGPNGPDANGVALQDWVTRSYLIPNLSGSPAKIMLKWELDARTDTAVADGWLLDNVIFTVSGATANVAPTASTLPITTVATTASANVAPIVTDANMPLDSFQVAITSTPKRGTAVPTDVVGNTDTVRYTPTGDWTGIDNTMLYSVTDRDGAGFTLGGQQAIVTVNPKFDTGVDMGDTSGSTVGTVGGNVWKAQNASGISVDINGTAGAVASVSPSVDAPTDAMLRDYVKASSAATGLRVNFDINPGIYSFYLYWVASEATAQTFDVYLKGGADVVNDSYKGSRVENNLTMGAQGTWVKTGPYTVKVTSDRALTVRAVDGGIAALAGIEWYQGGSYTNFTASDINPRNLGETAAGSGTFGTGNGGTITAFGNDIWNNEDGFRYVYKAERGDLDVVTKIDSYSLGSNVWAKAGIMFRESSDAGSRMIFYGITGQATNTADAIATQYRTTTNGAATVQSGNGGVNVGTRPNPVWLKVEKRGTQFKVYRSSDGINFGTALATYTVDVGTTYLYGIAVSSHDNGVSASATFSGVTTTLQ